MADQALQHRWEITERFLENALSVLAEQPEVAVLSCSKFLEDAERFLSHNELEQALDSLAEAGKISSPRARFWDSLRQAAEQMELTEKADEFQLLWSEAASLSLQQEANRR
jgi:hypothetical protein